MNVIEKKKQLTINGVEDKCNVIKLFERETVLNGSSLFIIVKYLNKKLLSC